MHEVSWRRVKWPRPSWVRKDLLSVCGIVLGSIAVSRQYLLACCGGLLEASSAPLGGPLGASGRAPGADFGLLDGPCSPWAAPGPVPGRPLGSPGRPGRPPGPLLAARGPLLDLSWAALGRSWRLLGGPWGPFGASWAALGAPWAAPKSLSAEKPEFVDSMAFFEVFWASGSSPGAS